MEIRLSEHRRLLVEETEYQGTKGLNIGIQYNTKKNSEWKFKGGLFLNNDDPEAMKKLCKALSKHLKKLGEL